MIGTRNGSRGSKRWLPARGAVGVWLSVGVVPACVPNYVYQDQVATAEAEHRLRQQAMTELGRVRTELQQLNQQLTRREEVLASKEEQVELQTQTIEEGSLNANMLTQERDDAARMVDQLRGELGRVGDHLRLFAKEKQELAAALEEARQRSLRLDRMEERAAFNVLVMRDLTYALYRDLGEGKVVLAATGGQPTVRLSSKDTLDANARVLPEASERLALLAAAVGQVPGARLSVTERAYGQASEPEHYRRRLESIATVLKANGLTPARIALVLPPGAAADSAGAVAEAGQRLDELSADLEAANRGADAGDWRDGAGSIELSVLPAAPRDHEAKAKTSPSLASSPASQK